MQETGNFGTNTNQSANNNAQASGKNSSGGWALAGQAASVTGTAIAKGAQQLYQSEAVRAGVKKTGQAIASGAQQAYNSDAAKGAREKTNAYMA